MYSRLLSNCSKAQQHTPLNLPLVWAFLILSMMNSGCSNPNEMPADDDAFVSYLQSVSSLTRQLKLKFDNQSKGASISGLGLPEAQNSSDRIEASFKEVIKYKEAVRALPKDARERFYQLYDELWRSTKAECERLKKLHSDKPQILANGWDRFCQVTSSVDPLND